MTCIVISSRAEQSAEREEGGERRAELTLCVWQSNGRERGGKGEAWEPESERRRVTGGWGGERGLRALPPAPCAYSLSIGASAAFAFPKKTIIFIFIYFTIFM